MEGGVGEYMTTDRDGVEETETVVREDVGHPVDSVRLWTWRQWIRPLFVLCYSLFSCVVLPLLIWDMYYNQSYFAAYAWMTAGACTLIAIGVSSYGILSHIVYFSRPNQQRYVIRYI